MAACASRLQPLPPQKKGQERQPNLVPRTFVLTISFLNLESPPAAAPVSFWVGHAPWSSTARYVHTCGNHGGNPYGSQQNKPHFASRRHRMRRRSLDSRSWLERGQDGPDLHLPGDLMSSNGYTSPTDSKTEMFRIVSLLHMPRKNILQAGRDD